MGILSVLLLLTLVSIAGVVVCLGQPKLKHRDALAYAFALTATAFIAFPLSIAAAFLATPFWSWLGSLLGVRLVGRGGPRMICYVGVLIVCMTVLGACSTLVVRRGLQHRRTE